MILKLFEILNSIFTIPVGIVVIEAIHFKHLPRKQNMFSEYPWEYLSFIINVQKLALPPLFHACDRIIKFLEVYKFHFVSLTFSYTFDYPYRELLIDRISLSTITVTCNVLRDCNITANVIYQLANIFDESDI